MFIDVRKRLVRSVPGAYNAVMDDAVTDADSCYRAVTARDARFDGLFYTAVRTTGIYCRPVCAARTPKRTSCAFYRTAAAAESAGFRPCLRCRPELAPGRVDVETSLAGSILAHLQSHALDDVDGEALARRIGLSSRQVRRILADRFGVTPIEIVQTQRLLFARHLLRDTDLPMTQLAYASGFRSVRRFNAAFRDRYGASPSTLRRVARPDGADLVATSDEATRSGSDIVLRLSYRPPLAWDTLCRSLARRGTAGVEAVTFDGEHATYRRTVAVALDGRLVSGWVAVDARASTRAPRREPRTQAHVLTVTLSGTLLPVLMPTTLRLRELFDLDADPERIATHLGADPLLRAEVRAAPGLRMPGAWDRFELALRAVLGQQISVAGASTLSGRLAARFGVPIETPFIGLDRSTPRADVLASADLDAIAAIGVPRSRAQTIRALARFAVDGGLDMPPGTTCDDAVTALDAVPGIGPWTAHYIAMRALRHPDAFPAGDLGLRKAAAMLAGEPVLPSESELEARAETWRPWRAYAAATLWQALARRATEGPVKKGART